MPLGDTGGKKPVATLRYICEDNIKMDFNAPVS